MTDEREEQPVNEIDRIEGIQIIVEDCVVCGETHYHGTGGTVPAIGELKQRVGHCTGGDGYYLKRTEGTVVETRG